MKKKGSALLVVVIVMMITFLLAAFLVDASIKSNRLNADTNSRTKAYYCAEAGIYDFIDYINSQNCNVTSGTSIANLHNNGGLYSDNMASYKATLMSPITTTQNDSNSTKTSTFDIYSSGSYGSQGTVIVAKVSIKYVKDNEGVFRFSSYSINSKKVYKA
jgi:Tfp pilus assembly protein PilX